MKEEITGITKFSNFLEPKIFEEHKEDFKYINDKITNALKDYENFLGIDFCDVSAGGIQIRGHHKKIERYTFGNQPTIKYDFSNINEVIEEFIKMWKDNDNENYISFMKSFIEDGEKYGWD